MVGFEKNWYELTLPIEPAEYDALICLGKDKVWKWQPDGFMVQQAQWEDWQPNNLTSQHCAAANTRRFRWNDQDCGKKLYFACMTKNSKEANFICSIFETYPHTDMLVFVRQLLYI